MGSATKQKTVKIIKDKINFKEKGICHYFNIPNESVIAFGLLKLNRSEILVYLLLLRRANGTEERTAFPSIKGMSRDLCISERQISNATRKLKDLGLIEVLELGGTRTEVDGSVKWYANLYRVNYVSTETI